jgi:cytochrome c peroxidase
MKSAFDTILAAASVFLIAIALSSCGEDAANNANMAVADVPASDGMRMAALKRAVLANGFARADSLAVPVSAAKRDAGKLIFSSPLMSLNGSISCQDCHLDQFGSTDGLPNAVGVGGTGVGPERLGSGGRILPRNVLPFWGRGSKGFDTFFWDGKVTKVDGQVISQFGDGAPSGDPLVVAAHLPSVELLEMVADTPEVRASIVSEEVSSAAQVQATLARRFASDAAIGPRLAAAFALPRDKIGFEEVADALASFIRDEFRIRPTPLERFVFDDGPIGKRALSGGILFYGRGKCAACHAGPYFSDFAFHAVAFPQAGFGKNGFGIDEGRYNVTLDPRDRFLFRTPPLYNVSKTAPYSHSGSLTRLEDAIVAHFDPLRLVDTGQMTPTERADLYTRLGPASREILPASLTNEEVRELVTFLRMLDF